jgi:RNA polymerase sigma factor (TIGR02999 family)
MDPSGGGEVTRLLAGMGRGDLDRVDAVNRLFGVVYGELRRLAAGLLREERPDHTLQPTALVNEAYLRLVNGAPVPWQNRAHFFGIAATAMRRILVEHARRRAAAKRGGSWQRVTLDERIETDARFDIEILDLDRLLSRLGAMDGRMERVVEMRVFCGMEMGEIAHILGVSERTVHNDWRIAKMWLTRELSEGRPA